LILSGAFYPDLKIGVLRRERINAATRATFTSTICICRENGSHRVANTIDLSLGGAKISSKAQFPLAKTLDLFLILGSRANPLKCGVVYPQKASPNSACFYTGLKFHLLSDADEHLLQNYFLSLEKTDGSSA
jgi:hypothetical protein